MIFQIICGLKSNKLYKIRPKNTRIIIVLTYKYIILPLLLERFTNALYLWTGAFLWNRTIEIEKKIHKSRLKSTRFTIVLTYKDIQLPDYYSVSQTSLTFYKLIWDVHFDQDFVLSRFKKVYQTSLRTCLTCLTVSIKLGKQEQTYQARPQPVQLQ